MSVSNYVTVQRMSDIFVIEKCKTLKRGIYRYDIVKT